MAAPGATKGIRMAETVEQPDAGTEAQSVQAEDILGLNPEVIRDVIVALDADDGAAIQRIVEPLHPAEIADLIEMLRGGMRMQIIEHLRPNFDPVILAELDWNVRDEVAEQLGTDTIAKAIAALDSDDALNLISALEETKQRRVLHAIPSALRSMLEEGLAFPEDSAGRLMQREFVAVPAFWTVGEVIDFLRESDDLPDDFYDIFVVDPRHRLIGAVALNRVLRTKRPVPIGAVMERDIVTVPVGMDQEEVAYIFAQQDLLSAAVVDASDRLIGVIMIDDIVDVIHEEAEEDLMRLGGVQEDDLYHAVIETGRSRFLWLFVNLGTAILASSVIGLFQGRMEFGPRALGSRSIIADPRSTAMQSVLNLKIKFRESFRPFAPAVLRERVTDWFDLDYESPYMLLVAAVTASQRIPIPPGTESLFGIEKLSVPRSTVPAVTHVDDSARVQTVRRDGNPLYYDIIRAFDVLTGCPIIVNTSFNVKDEPIVCTPEDAYRCFMKTQMDVLVLESHVIVKPAA